MAPRRFFISAILLTCAINTSAHPHAIDLRSLQTTNPSTLSIIIPQTSEPDVNSTAPPRPPGPVGAIVCFEAHPTRPKTNVDGCRPTLNYFRGFPNYRLVQDFQEGRYPKVPSKPPYSVHHKHSNCAIEIASNNPSIRDQFSFEQARALATEILEVCQDKGGRGGTARIGHGIGWRVSVVGYILPPDPPDGLGVLEEGGEENGTSSPAVVVNV